MVTNDNDSILSLYDKAEPEVYQVSEKSVTQTPYQQNREIVPKFKLLVVKEVTNILL